MKNPKNAGVTGTFSMAICKSGTQIVFETKSSIPGVTISAGKLSDITLKKVDSNALQTKNKVMDYELRFRIKNPIPQGISFISQLKILKIFPKEV